MPDRQMSLVEALLDPRIGLHGKLKAFSQVIDWAPLGELASRVRPATTGRKPYDALAMLKALYLASLYDLSDPALEAELVDRVSFRLFCGFALDETTPDETTLCRFRNACIEAGVLAEAFAAVNRQLDEKGLIARKGTLIDATIVAAASRRPPAEAGRKPVLASEPAASFTRKARSPARAAKAILATGCILASTPVLDEVLASSAAWRSRPHMSTKAL